MRIEDLLKHRAWVGALARSLVRDENTALDLVQDTWTTALDRPPVRTGSLRGWLGTVLRNRLRDRHRVEARRGRRDESVSRSDGAPSAAELAARADSHRRVMDAVISLEEPYREAILLRYWEGLTTDEVAERQRVTPSTARTRLKRARDRLREKLDDRHGGDRRAWVMALVPFLAERPAKAGGIGGSLMAHKLTILTVSLLALVGISIIVSAQGPATAPAAPREADETPITRGDEAAPGEPGLEEAGEETTPARAFRLAETTRADAPAVPIRDTVTLEVAADGKMTLGIEGEKPLLHRLMIFAEEKRDLGHPMQPSMQGILLRVDARAPWRAVAAAFELPDDPDVRIHRIYWGAQRGETEVGLPVFAAKDRGLARTKTKLVVRLRRHLVLTRGTSTSIRYQDRELGEGEAAFGALAGFLPARDEAVRKHAVLLHVDGDVPFQDIVRVVELLPKPYAEHLAGRRPSRLAGLLRADGNAPAKGTVEDLEARFVPKKEDRDRVRELLARMEVGDAPVNELRERVHPSSSVALGLGVAYVNRGGAEDCLRAIALSRLVVESGAVPRYGARWWDAERLLLRAVLGYGRAKKDRSSLEMAHEIAQGYSDLGLLERSPARGEILRLAAEIDTELERHE